MKKQPHRPPILGWPSPMEWVAKCSWNDRPSRVEYSSNAQSVFQSMMRLAFIQANLGAPLHVGIK